MKTDKLRKYLIPNLPYLFIGWVFLKLGTAYRLAAGFNFWEKLLGLGQAIGTAFLLQKQERQKVQAGCGVRLGPVG